MTDNEIIKALECCTDESYENCNECPYSTDTLSCERLKLLEDSLDLINSLKAEIERLNSVNDEKFNQWNILAEKTKQHYADLYNEAKDILKAEAVKEFAERLKNKIKIECNPYCKPTYDYDTSISILHYIDKLVEEMITDKE